MNTVLLTEVEQFHIPSHIIDHTDRVLREAGDRRAEMFVLWTGHVAGKEFTAAKAYVPEQQAHHLPDGLCVTVAGPALHSLNRWLYEQRQTLAIQVHTHPSEAYHSTTDDTYPIVTQRGGLSLVVPFFAEAGVRGPGTALYRLDTRGWHRLRARPAKRILKLDSQPPITE